MKETGGYIKETGGGMKKTGKDMKEAGGTAYGGPAWGPMPGQGQKRVANQRASPHKGRSWLEGNPQTPGAGGGAHEATMTPPPPCVAKQENLETMDHNPLGLPHGKNGRTLEHRIVSSQGGEEQKRHNLQSDLYILRRLLRRGPLGIKTVRDFPLWKGDPFNTWNMLCLPMEDNNIIMKHSDSLDFPASITELREEVEHLPGDSHPSRIVQEEHRLYRAMKENRVLVTNCEELQMKMDAKEAHCSRLQEKVTKDAAHISSLGSSIERLRTNMRRLQSTVETGKDTQERVREEYEETLMKQRSLFDEETQGLNQGLSSEGEEVRRGSETERKKLGAELTELKAKLEVKEATLSLRT